MSVNELASVHGKDVERLMNEMLTTKSDFGKDNLKYVNKEIAMQWLGIAPPEGAASLTDAQQSTANIIQNFQNPKIEARNSLITPEMDATYLDAVERGDIILLNGGMLITSGDEHCSTMHEYAHSITKKHLGERLAEVTASILETEIDKARKEMLP